MFRNQSKNTECLRISYLKPEQDGSIVVKDTEFVVVLNTSSFAVAAMIRGFLEHYAAHIGDPSPEDTKLLEVVTKETEEFRGIAMTGQARVANRQAQASSNESSVQG